MKMLNSFKFIILHCCFFSGDSNSSFRYSSYSFPAYSASQNLCFVLSCGILVSSMSSVDSILFLSGVLILQCEYQSLMIIKIVMSILFNWRVSLQVDPIIFNIRKINSKSSQRCLFHPSQIAFVFPPSLPPFFFFFKDSDFLIKHPFLSL